MTSDQILVLLLIVFMLGCAVGAALWDIQRDRMEVNYIWEPELDLVRKHLELR